MKRTAILTLALVLFTAILFAQKTETRPISGFDQIALSGGYEKCTLREGPNEGVKITASGVELDRIETKLNGRTLEIGMKNGNYRNTHIELEITFKSLRAIDNSGSTNIICESTIRGDRFELNSSGSGNFEGSFEVKKLDLDASGSTNAKLSGRADEQEIDISGSGNVDASHLKGDKADVDISGSGNVKLSVERVSSSVSGSGRVTNKS